MGWHGVTHLWPATSHNHVDERPKSRTSNAASIIIFFSKTTWNSWVCLKLGCTPKWPFNEENHDNPLELGWISVFQPDPCYSSSSLPILLDILLVNLAAFLRCSQKNASLNISRHQHCSRLFHHVHPSGQFDSPWGYARHFWHDLPYES